MFTFTVDREQGVVHLTATNQSCRREFADRAVPIESFFTEAWQVKDARSGRIVEGSTDIHGRIIGFTIDGSVA